MSGATVIILARAGSKGVPGKNVALVAGRPCIAWSIEHALGTAGVGRVVVSSDDARALEVARGMGVETIERPEALAHDRARIDDAARHAATVLGLSEEGHVAILYANVPVRPADLTGRALGLLVESGCDSVQSYERCGKHHPWWTARVEPDGRVRPWEGEVLNHGVFRRQDLPPAFVPDGGTMALRVAALMLRVAGSGEGPHAFFGRDRRGIESPEGSVVDIDTRVDLLVADAILRERAGVRPAAGMTV